MVEPWQHVTEFSSSDIDENHKKIAVIFSALEAALVSSADATVILEYLTEFVEVICNHVSYKGAIMHSASYVDAYIHQQDHYKIIRMLSSLMCDYQAGNRQIIEDVRSLMGAWRWHLGHFDKPLAAAVMQNMIGASAAHTRPL